eukprot:727197-Amphidinium_carterae.1
MPTEGIEPRSNSSKKQKITFAKRSQVYNERSRDCKFQHGCLFRSQDLYAFVDNTDLFTCHCAICVALETEPFRKNKWPKQESASMNESGGCNVNAECFTKVTLLTNKQAVERSAVNQTVHALRI